MKSIMRLGLVVMALLTFAGCQRIETGEVGLRKDFYKQIQPGMLQPGSMNQTLVGEVLVFHTKQLTLDYKHLTPQTADHTNMKDVDVQVVYNVNPGSVFDIYTTKSQSMHSYQGSDIFLMYNFMATVVSSSTQDAISKYNALDVATHRTEIESAIRTNIQKRLKDEKLDTAITIDLVQMPTAVPSDAIVESATQVINAQNALKAKQVEVQTAEAEAKRLKALAGSTQSIEYMKAKALADIAEGVKDGKVNSIVIPYDFKGLIQVK